jgi:uncharacterized protein (TIGR02266 family)
MAQDDDLSDQRRGDRTPVTLVVEYEGAEDLIGDYTENLSSGGAFVATSRPLAVGTAVQLVLRFPGLLEAIKIEGTVRWTRGEAEGAGVGLEFAAGPARDQVAQAIQRIVARDPRTVKRLCRVLVVEDNHHIAQLIHDGLKAWQRREPGQGVAFEVHSAGDGQQAIELLKQQWFDALIIDVYLPVVAGPKLIQIIRKELGLTDVAIIAVSGGGDPARASALDAGANIFLDKPMRLRQVIDTIHRLLGA